MSGGVVRRTLAMLFPLLTVQAILQVGQRPDETDGRSVSWLDDPVLRVLIASFIAILIAFVVGILLSSRKPEKPRKPEEPRKPGEYVSSIGGGFPPTAPLLVPVFTLAVLVLQYGPAPAGGFRSGKILLMASVIAVTAWVIAAVWQGPRSGADCVVPELYERLKTEYLSLRAASIPDDAIVKAATLPAAVDGPLPQDRIPVYLEDIGKEMGFCKEPPEERLKPSASAWHSGTAYLENQRKLDYVRNSLIAWEDRQGPLTGHAYALELRLVGSHLPDTTRTSLTLQLDTAKKKIESGAEADLKAGASTLCTIAAALSSYAYTRQRALLRLQSQQHWLVVVAQVIGAFLLAIAVLAGSSRDAIAAAIVFFLIGAGSGILSLLHIRQEAANPNLGDDYGLFRVELARAFTLSGMAAVIAVLLLANLPVLAGTGVFDPPAATESPATSTAMSPDSTPGTPVATEVQATSVATPPVVPSGTPAGTGSGRSIDRSIHAFGGVSLFQPAPAGQDDATVPALPAPTELVAGNQDTELVAGNQDSEDEDADPEWRSLTAVYSFSNLGGILVALIAGWVPERIFRTLTDYGNRLRLDIQSVS